MEGRHNRMRLFEPLDVLTKQGYIFLNTTLEPKYVLQWNLGIIKDRRGTEQ